MPSEEAGAVKITLQDVIDQVREEGHYGMAVSHALFYEASQEAYVTRNADSPTNLVLRGGIPVFVDEKLEGFDFYVCQTAGNFEEAMESDGPDWMARISLPCPYCGEPLEASANVEPQDAEYFGDEEKMATSTWGTKIQCRGCERIFSQGVHIEEVDASHA